MRDIIHDFRLGLRLLASDLGFAAVAILTLALGIASTTTVFSWVDGVIEHPFPGVEGGERLVAVESLTEGAPTGASRHSFLDYRELRDQMKFASGLVAHRDEVFSAGGAGDNQPVWGEAVSVNYFEALGVRPVLGRVFTAQECGDVAGACPVAVVSHAFWRERLAADASIIGKPVRVNRREFVVAGVAPPEFRGTVTGLRYDLWIPLTMSAELGLGSGALTDRGNRGLDVLARLASGATIEQARSEASAIARRLADEHPKTNRNVSATVVPVGQMRSGAAALLRAPLGILMAVSLVVLLIVCANVGNLLLARSLARTRELSVRIALGASRLRVARQLMAETLPLALAGVLTGLPLAFWMGDLLPLLIPKIGVPVAVAFGMSSRVLIFAVVACVGATLLSSIGLVLLSQREELNEALKEGGRSGAQGRQSHKAQSSMVIAQVALATLSLVSAGLFLRSFENARAIHPGFDAEKLLLARFYVSGSHYTPDGMRQFFDRLAERMEARAGVVSASYGDYAPLGSNTGPYTKVEVEGYAPGPDEPMLVSENQTAPGYLKTLGVPLLDGRDFNAQDTLARPGERALIVNEAFARKYMGGANPLGRRVKAWGQWRTVVGMARDSRYFHPAEPAQPFFYSPLAYSSNTSISVYFLVRTSGDPRAAIPLLRAEAAALDGDSLAMQPMPMKEWIGVTLLPQKVAASLMAALGVISLLLAAVGLYSAMAYAVTRRTKEFGIRMALGADMHQVMGDVLRRSFLLLGSGLVVGLAASAALTRVVETMLVRVSPLDPATYAGVAVFLVLIGFAACAIPARRATRVDPMSSMREG